MELTPCCQFSDERQSGPYFYKYLLNPNALVPVDFFPDDNEFQVPYCPINYGLAAGVYSLNERSVNRTWYRNCFDDNDLMRVERQIDTTPFVMTTTFFPFATPEGSHFSNKIVVHTFTDDAIEEMGALEGLDKRRSVCELASRNHLSYS